MIEKLGHCRVCSAKQYTVLFTKIGYDVVKCDTCCLVYLDFVASKEFSQNYYSEEFFNDKGTKHAYTDYEKESKFLKKSFLKRIELLRKYQSDGNLLDIGCATGSFMEKASNFYKVSGIDVSDYAIKQAKSKKLDVWQGMLDDSPYRNQVFDVVTLWDTIEHVADPKETIAQVGKIVRPEGIIGLTTGDVGSIFAQMCGSFWHLYNIPQHLSYFDKKTITKILNNAGFEVKEIVYPSINLTLDYLLFRFITFYNLRFLMPIYVMLKDRGFLEKAFDINLHDIMFVVAQKIKKSDISISS